MKVSPLAMLTLLLLACGRSASAQPVAPMSFVGGGVSWGQGDSEHRISYPSSVDAPGRRHLLWVDAAIRGSHWLAIGGDIALLEPVAGRFITRDGTSRQTQTERVLSGLVRVRAVRTGRLSVDAVGGPAILFGHHEASFDDGRTTNTTSTDTKVLAWTAGADVSLALVRGAGLAGVLRLYRLERDGADSSLPFQTASTRAVAGIGVRFGS